MCGAQRNDRLCENQENVHLILESVPQMEVWGVSQSLSLSQHLWTEVSLLDFADYLYLILTLLTLRSVSMLVGPGNTLRLALTAPGAIGLQSKRMWSAGEKKD